MVPFRFRTADLACGWRSPAVQPKLSHQVLMFAYLSCQEAICRMHKGAQVRQSCVGFSNFPAFLQISSFTQAIGCAVSVYVFITQGLFSNAVVTPLVDQLRWISINYWPRGQVFGFFRGTFGFSDLCGFSGHLTFAAEIWSAGSAHFLITPELFRERSGDIVFQFCWM